MHTNLTDFEVGVIPVLRFATRKSMSCAEM